MKRLIMTVVALLVIPACAPVPCITPPPMETSDQQTIAGSIAVQLAQLPAGGNLSASYSDLVKATYDKLADNDKALFLFLLAIDCYLKDGKVGQDIAKQMAQVVQAKWGAKEATTKDLRKIDQRHPELAPRIHEIMKKVGLE